MSRTLFETDEAFRSAIEQTGHKATEAGLVKLVKKSLKKMTLAELARQLGCSPNIIRTVMKKNGVKNPNRAGGKNNPYGVNGKSGLGGRRHVAEGRKEDHRI